MSLHRRGLLAGLTGLLGGGCSPTAWLNANTPREGYTLQPNIPYGAHRRQKLDYYTPTAPRPDGKTVVFFHGGGWYQGHKHEFLFLAQALASNGIAVVIPNYRLYPEVRFPVFLEDCALAVGWAAGQIGIDKLFVMGHSAGAYNAAMMAANTPYLANVGVDRMRLRGFIGIAGAYNFLPLTRPEAIDLFGGPNNPDTQPITFATSPLPPALLLHGSDDASIDPRQSVDFAAAWQATGAQAQLTVYPQTDHARILGAFLTRGRGTPPSRDDTVAWIDTH